MESSGCILCELQHDVVRWQAFFITRNLLDFRVSFKQRICKAEVNGAACGQIVVQRLWHAVMVMCVGVDSSLLSCYSGN